MSDVDREIEWLDEEIDKCDQQIRLYHYGAAVCVFLLIAVDWVEVFLG